MDHRTIVSFFTCQLVWVNRYEGDCKALQQEVDAKKKELADTKAWNEYVKTVNARTPKRCQLKNVGAIW